MPLRVLHTVNSLHPDAGGPSRTVGETCAALAAAGVEVEIVTVRHSPGAPARLPEGVKVSFGEGGFWGFAQTLRTRIQRVQPDILHDHGMWLPTNVLSAWVSYQAGVRRVVTPRGMLEPWAMQHQRLKKLTAWYGYQRYITQCADLIHATAPMEARHLRTMGLTSPLATIPNGVSLPDDWPEPVPRNTRHRALFLSRIHPKKGLPMLLRAWALLQPPGWELIIIGPDENGHRAAMERLAREEEVSQSVSFRGPVDDTAKWAWYRGSDLFVLPTHSENFGVVVGEALAAGVPVITTTGAPWSVLEEHGCGWWVEIGQDALYDALVAATDLSDEARSAMGQCGQSLVQERFTWPQIAAQMTAAYRWLLSTEKTTSPEYVLT